MVMNSLKILMALLLLVVPAKAQNSEVQGVISGQIEAFLKDDVSTAYTYAAPNIKQMFVTSSRFGTMVQKGYPMIYRPSSYRFTEAREVNGTRYQNVLIRDQAGLFYVAEYALIETAGGWKIKGVRLFTRPEAGA
jgi:hypothetical protein